MARGGRLEDVERVYSHGLSLAQCRNWLRQNLPDAEKHAVASNAEAARRARNADDSAAIAGENAPQAYGFKLIDGPIEDFSDHPHRLLHRQSDAKGKIYAVRDNFRGRRTN